MTHVRVDVTKCTGVGLCEMTAPTVFEIGDDGLSRVIDAEPVDADLEAAREAVTKCPTQALAIEEIEGGSG